MTIKATYNMFELFQCTACLAAVTRSKFVQVSVRIKRQSAKSAIIPRSLAFLPSLARSSHPTRLCAGTIPFGKEGQEEMRPKAQLAQLLRYGFSQSICYVKCLKSQNP